MNVQVRIEKGPIQTVAIKLEALNSLEITKVVKPFIRREWTNTFSNIVYLQGRNCKLLKGVLINICIHVSAI